MNLVSCIKRVLIGFCIFSFLVQASDYDQLSLLERDLVDEGLAVYDLSPHDDPINKVVRKIYILTVSPFSEDSGFLTFLNRWHINTKEEVIRRELIQKEGQLFDAAAVRDSEFILRARNLVRSTAVIIPVKAKNTEHENDIDLLVVTRDLISLRPSFSFKGSFDLLTNLSVSVGEHNLLGHNKAIAGLYEMQQGQHIWSASYFDPRIFGSPFEFTVKPSVVILRDNLKFDGLMGDLRIEKPLLSEGDRFGYGIEAIYGSRSIIDFNGSKVRMLEIPTSNGIEQVERKYRWRYGRGALFSRLSFGRTYKKEVFLRYGFNVKRPSIPDDIELDEHKRNYILKNLLPRNELESFITVGFSYFHNQFLTMYDYDNFHLQETKRVGPSVTISNDFSSRAVLLSDHYFLRPEAKISLLKPFNEDSFIYLTASTSNRFDGAFNDNVYKYGLTLVSPKIFGAGRVVYDARLSTIDDNRDNQKFVLGSDSGIRGVESRAYSGEKGFRSNLELRSAPFDLWIFHVGAVVFYDVGGAFDKWRKADPTHALGFGLRFLAPQLSSAPFRIDLAFPIYGKGREHHVMVPSFGTGQAF